MKRICNVKETISEEEEEAFATILASFLLLPIVGPTALIHLIWIEQHRGVHTRKSRRSYKPGKVL
jgi:hypothetical protein